MTISCQSSLSSPKQRSRRARLCRSQTRARLTLSILSSTPRRRIVHINISLDFAPISPTTRPPFSPPLVSSPFCRPLHTPAKMHYDTDDNYYHPFAPRTGPAAMPSPRSRRAPYFSGRADIATFEDFLEEFEDLAHACELTEPQQVDALVRYLDPTSREFCRTRNGYRMGDWVSFRKDLIHAFGTVVPPHRVKMRKLRALVEDSSRSRMTCEDDVLQYYRDFMCYSLPLVHSHHLTAEDRDAAFWSGFHPIEREVLLPRVLAKSPLQPVDIPFHFEDVFDSACAAFAYVEGLWFRPREREFEPRYSSRRYPSHSYTSDPCLPSTSRSYSDFHVPSSFSPLPSEFRHTLAPSETEVQPESVPEPEIIPSNSITLPTLFSILPTTSPASSCTNPVPESEPKPTSTTPTSPPLLTTSTLVPSCTTTNVVQDFKSDVIPSITSSSPSNTSSCTAVVSEPESVSDHASSSLFPSMSPVLTTPSLPTSCTDAVAEPEPKCSAPTDTALTLSTSPTPSLASPIADGAFENTSTPSPVSIEPTPESTPSITPMSLAPPLCVLLSADDTSGNMSTPLPLSSMLVPPFLFSKAPTEGQLPEPTSTLPSVPSIDPTTSPSILPDLDCHERPEPERSASPTSISPVSSPSLFDSPPILLASSEALSVSCELESTLVPAADLVLLSRSELFSKSSSKSRDTFTLAPAPLVVSNATISPNSTSQERTLGVTAHDVTPGVTSTSLTSAQQSTHSDPSRSHASARLLSTPAISSSRFDPPVSSPFIPIVPTSPLEDSPNVPSPPQSPNSSPSQPALGLVQDDSLSDSLDDSLTIPTHRYSTTSRRPPGLAQVDSDPTTLEVTLAPMSLAAPPIPQQRSVGVPSLEDSLNAPVSPHSTTPRRPPRIVREDLVPISVDVVLAPALPVVPSIPQQRPLEVTQLEISSTLAPHHFHLSPSTIPSGRSSSHVFALGLVATTVLVSALLVISSTVTTHARKSWSKSEDFGNRRNGPLLGNNHTHQHQHVQYTARPARLVFDPGGLVSF